MSWLGSDFGVAVCADIDPDRLIVPPAVTAGTQEECR
jgi:hypothetical protein